MKKSTLYFITAGIFFLLFVALIAGLCLTKGSAPVGFAPLNQNAFKSVGSNLTWYNVTEYLGMIPIFVALCFGGFGLGQWIERKDLKKVDKDLFCLAGLYLSAAVVYVVFEVVVLNMRPILIDGAEEASFPSSHTVLVCVILFSTALQIRSRCKRKGLSVVGQILCYLLAATVSIGRFLAGVHWLTDIIGGLFISTALVLCYYGATCLLSEREAE